MMDEIKRYSQPLLSARALLWFQMDHVHPVRNKKRHEKKTSDIENSILIKF